MTLEVPDSFVETLHLDGPEGNRRALELMALEAYRSAQISGREVGKLLGKSFHETEAFLKEHNASQDISVEEFVTSVDELKELLRKSR